ncbi:MAG TPA: DegV family protein [Dermatophilaceae bacterium]|nr:DegV family protein [Dermatophilaceae bacterium]
MNIAVVTDSTAYLPDVMRQQAGVTVVPLHVIVGDHEYTEGVDLTAQALATALRSSARVSTSRPSPQVFLDTYERLAAAGATAVVSIHLSAGLSGTCDSALLAARQAPIPVTVVDSTTMGMGLGFAVLDAAAAARQGRLVTEVTEVARTRAAASRVLFYVHSLEYLRRGGRIGAASAMLGSALAIKPLLTLTDGHIEPVEKQRTTRRALVRLLDLSIQVAERSPAAVAVAVHHLDAEERAAWIVGQLADRLAGRLTGSLLGRPIPGATTSPRQPPDPTPPGQPLLVELGAVAGAHLGPGTIAVVVSPYPGSPLE